MVLYIESVPAKEKPQAHAAVVCFLATMSSVKGSDFVSLCHLPFAFETSGETSAKSVYMIYRIVLPESDKNVLKAFPLNRSFVEEAFDNKTLEGTKYKIIKKKGFYEITQTRVQSQGSDVASFLEENAGNSRLYDEPLVFRRARLVVQE